MQITYNIRQSIALDGNIQNTTTIYIPVQGLTLSCVKFLFFLPTSDFLKHEGEVMVADKYFNIPSQTPIDLRMTLEF